MVGTGFTCSCCGEYHAELARAIPVKMPTSLARVPPAERSVRAWLSTDQCVIDDGRFFRYGSLELPIQGEGEPFIWGVWVELSPEDYAKSEAGQSIEGRETERPCNGILATDIPFYGQPTERLPVLLREQPVGTRPIVSLAQEGHILWSEQRDGIPVQRVQEIMEWFLHGRFK
jgi:hypothetical protein